MTRSAFASRSLDNPPIPVQMKLAAAWTSLMFLYIYVDYLVLYKPGHVDNILNGVVWEFTISQTFLVLAFFSMSLPILMILLSMTLAPRCNRAANLLVAALFVPYSIFNAAGETWAYFFSLTIGIELLILTFILRSAWVWPRDLTPLLDALAVDRPRNQAQG